MSLKSRSDPFPPPSQTWASRRVLARQPQPRAPGHPHGCFCCPFSEFSLWMREGRKEGHLAAQTYCCLFSLRCPENHVEIKTVCAKWEPPPSQQGKGLNLRTPFKRPAFPSPRPNFSCDCDLNPGTWEAGSVPCGFSCWINLRCEAYPML